MDLFSAIETRTSCRQFTGDSVEREIIERILAAGTRAPSPLNAQPWQFIVITDEARKKAVHEEAERCRAWAVEQSGWKWMSKYEMDFLLQAPVLVAVVGDPKKSGMDMFQADGPVGRCCRQVLWLPWASAWATWKRDWPTRRPAERRCRPGVPRRAFFSSCGVGRASWKRST